MRTIPAGITNLIKSKSMLGSDAPQGWVEFPDIRVDLIDGTWLPDDSRTFRRVANAQDVSDGNYVQRADGKQLGCYQIVQLSGNPKVYLSTVDDEATIFSTDNAFAANEVEFKTKESPDSTISAVRLQKLTNGRLLLYIVEPGQDTVSACFIEVYESVNGLGTDFTKIGEVYRNTQRASYTGSISNDQNLGQPIQLESGRIILTYAGQNDWYFDDTYGKCECKVAYSDDGGATWTNNVLSTYTYVFGRGAKCIGKFGNRLVAASTQYYGIGALTFYYSDDFAETWYPVDFDSSDALYWTIQWGGLADDQNYLLKPLLPNSSIDLNLYKASVTTFPTTFNLPYDFGAIGSGATWEGIYDDADDPMGSLGWETLFVNQDTGALAIVGFSGGTYDGIVLNGVRRTLTTFKLQVTNMSVQREEAADSQRLTFSFPNVNPNDPTDFGYYMPYRSTEFGKTQNEWHLAIIPSAKVVAKMGYGSNMATVFTGEIDEVQCSADPKAYTISVDCRDMACRLIDKQVKLVTDGETEYYIEYPLPSGVGATYWIVPGATEIPDIADIVKDLCMRAGFAEDEVFVEQTDIQLDPLWEKMSYMDCINDLCTAAGFEFFIDEDGCARFYHQTDRSPAVTDEYHSLAANFTLAHYPLVSGSEVLTSEPNGGGTVFIKDTDYTINYATGYIEPFGIVGDSYCSYVYAAHVYQEGEDIFGLNLTLSRRNVYGTIRVAGDGEEASAITTSPLWDGSRVDADKVLFADNQYLDTLTKTQKCANRLKLDMLNRYVSTDFVGVAHPWLQVGDCIQVIESSTTISEIYKITAISFDLSPDGFSSSINSFHVGYTPLT